MKDNYNNDSIICNTNDIKSNSNVNSNNSNNDNSNNGDEIVEIKDVHNARDKDGNILTHKIEKKYIDNLDRNIDMLLKQKPLIYLTGEEFQKQDNKNFKEQVMEYFNFLGNKVENTVVGGNVMLTNSGIRKTIENGLYKEKTSAMKSIPLVLQNGIVINKELNWKNREYNTNLVVGIISINKKEYIVEIVIRENQDGSKSFYLEEVEDKNIFFERFQTSFKASGQRRLFNTILIDFIQNVKQNIPEWD